MGAIKRIAQEATDNVVRWLDSLSRKSGVYMGKDEMYKEVGEKAEKLMTNAPQMFEYYEDIPLYQGLREAVEGSEDLALMDPATFRKLAAPIATELPDIKRMMQEKQFDYEDMYKYGTKFDAIPYLSYKTPSSDMAKITAHEGRHRSRALEGLSEPYQLVRMIPAGREELLSKMPEGTGMYPEASFQNLSNFDSKDIEKIKQEDNIGSLGQLLKILGIAGVVTPGALSSLGGEDGS